MRAWPAAVLITLAMTNVASADEISDCIYADAPDVSIPACNSIIDAGKASTDVMALVYFNRGRHLANKFLYYDSISDATKAINLRPTYAEAYLLRANSYGRVTATESAIADATKAIQLKPDYAEAYASRALSYALKGLHDAAVADNTKAIQLKPNYATPYGNRATSYTRLQRYDLAIVDYTSAIALNPRNGNAYYGRGFSYQELGNLAKALPDFVEAAKLLSPDVANHEQALARIAWIRAQLGQAAPAGR